MNKIKNLEGKMEWCAKAIVVFLLIFIPCRNILEIFLGTYIKLIPDFLIFGLFVLFFVYQKGKVKFESYDIFVILFLGVAFINTIVVQGISIYTYIFAVRSTMLYYVLFFVIRNFEFEQKYMLKLTKILQYITYVLFVLGVIEKISNKTLLFPTSVAENIIYADNYARVYSMFFNPNTYGAFLVLSFFFVIHYGNKNKGMFWYQIVTIASLLLSMSRSSILIFVVGIVIYGLVFNRSELFHKKFLLRVLTVLLCGILLYGACEKVTEMIWFSGSGESTSVYDRMGELKDDEIIKQSNAVGRLFFVKTGLKVFRDYPLLGTGFGTYGSAASMSWDPPMYQDYGLPEGFYSDNEYIKDLVETGIVGMLILVALCVSLVYTYRKNVFSIFICVIFLWFGLFYNVLEVQIVSFLVWGTLGMTAPKKQCRKVEEI